MNLSSVLSSLGGTMKMLLPAIVPGASALPAIIKGAQALSDAFKSVKSANGGTAPADAAAAHDALMAKVNEHADETLGRLEGDG